MKKVCIVIVFAVILSICSCSESPSCVEIMEMFSREYPIEGVIYRSGREPHEEGYMSEELFRSVYVYSEDIPSDFAVFLNSRYERGAECGVFKTADSAERRSVVDMCYERISLVSPRGNEGFVITSGNIVFYSTLPEGERARDIFLSIVR